MKAKEMLKLLETAKDKPSRTCGGVEQEHDFYVFTMLDAKDYSMTYFKCRACGDLIKSKNMRRGQNKKLWQ